MLSRVVIPYVVLSYIVSNRRVISADRVRQHRRMACQSLADGVVLYRRMDCLLSADGVVLRRRTACQPSADGRVLRPPMKDAASADKMVLRWRTIFFDMNTQENGDVPNV